MSVGRSAFVPTHGHRIETFVALISAKYSVEPSMYGA